MPRLGTAAFRRGSSMSNFPRKHSIIMSDLLGSSEQYIILWHGKRLSLPVIINGQETLAQLKVRCSSLTGVQPAHLKLLYSGASGGDASGGGLMGWNWLSPFSSTPPPVPSGSWVVMKEDQAPLSKYGLKPGSKIMMLGDVDPLFDHQSHSTSSKRPASLSPQSSSSSIIHPTLSPEQRLLHKLEEIVNHVKSNVFPMLESYQKLAHAYLDPFPGAQNRQITPAARQKQLRDEYNKCSELLLQTLIKIDGVICLESMTEARRKRKDAVKFVQSFMEIIDGLRDKIASASKDRSDETASPAI